MNDEDAQERVRRARAAVDVADARRRNHVEAEATVAALAADLAVAVEAERQAAAAAADAEALIADATDRAEQLAAGAARIGEELETLLRAASEATARLQAVTDLQTRTPEDWARDIRDAEKALTLADDHLAAATTVLAGLEAGRREARARVESLQADDDEPPVDSQAIAEEVEWYLIARLATQRAVCLGGALPMLVDDALAALDQDQLAHVLDRLERMAGAVQVIVVSDDPRVSAWAVEAGFLRAAAVQPQHPDSFAEPQTAAPGATT